MTAASLVRRAGGDDLTRLRWLLCRTFGVAPWSKTGRALSDGACLFWAAQLLLDRSGQTAGDNPNFDPAVFRARKGGAYD